LIYENKIILPLSWSLGEKENVYRKIEMLGTIWLSLSEIVSFEDFRSDLSAIIGGGKGVIIRGCHKNVFNGNLRKLGFRFYPIGSEGIIRTSSDFKKKRSLRELIRRGEKRGEIREYKPSEIDVNKFFDLISNGYHSSEPKLQNLYRIDVDKYSRLFVLQNENQYLGAMTISMNNPHKYQAELLLRRDRAPVGIMEALVNFIKETLFAEGIELFSLGEVPFVLMQEGLHSFIPLLTNKIGRGLRFAYNYEGLFNFKNKFNPEWEDVYLAAFPKLSIRMLMNIFFNSKLHRLVLYKLKRQIMSV